MKNKINIAELLKDCPSGMELDCTCADNVVFDKIIEYEQIKCVIRECHDPLILDKYGRLLHICCPKCVIFPKGKTTWEGFHTPFKAGDIVTVIINKRIWYGIEYLVHYIKLKDHDKAYHAISFEAQAYALENDFLSEYKHFSWIKF